MTRIKICGLTRPDDVALASALGASAVGFVFAAGSPRRVSLERAEELSAGAGPGVERVGVFVEEERSFIGEAVQAAKLDVAQIHRPLRAADLDLPSAPIVAVVTVTGSVVAIPPPDLLRRCRWVLFDSGAGTGRRFDWWLLSGRKFDVPVFLAGGLDPDNVAQAIESAHPEGVDIASGVEQRPGVKDPEKMLRFFEAVREADESASAPSPSGRGAG